MAFKYFIEDKDLLKRQDGSPYIPFRDFAGKGNSNYAAYYPNFTVCITPEKAEELADAGFRIKTYTDNDGNDIHQILIYVRFDNFPPKVVKVCGRKKIMLDAESLVDLDRDELDKVELSISLSKGGACYLLSGYFTIAMDRLDSMYDFDDEDDGELPFN